MNTYFLEFTSDSLGRVQIDEPIGFNALNWVLSRGDNMYARDVSFNSGEFELEFVDQRNHAIENLLYYLHYYGYNAKVRLILNIDGDDNVLGDLDFTKSSTDDLTYLKLKIIQDSDLQIIKRRNDIKVNLKSDKSLDGITISPLVPQNVLVYAKPTYQTSVWEQPTPYSNTMNTKDNYRAYAVNPCVNITQSDIKDTLTFFDIETNNPSSFLVIRAVDNMKNISISIEDVSISLYAYFTGAGAGTPHGKVYFNFSIGYQNPTDPTPTRIDLETATLNKTESFSITNKDYNITIDSLQRGGLIFIYNYVILENNSLPSPTRKWNCDANISILKTTITSENTAYNTVTKAFRFIDVARYVINSISGKSLTAPSYDTGSDYYSTFITNGDLLRGLDTNPFTLSLEDIKKSALTESNGDIEVNDTVFMGMYKEFYNPTEIWFFDNKQFSQTVKKFNEKYAINQFNYKYDKYQSQKENEVGNTYDVIHGENENVLNSKFVENKKEVKIQWIRDAFMISEAQQKAYVVSKSTATQNDDDIYAIDTSLLVGSEIFNETTILNHWYDEVNNRLSLRNDASINFILLGIVVGSSFIIKPNDNNAGNYTVFSVKETELILTPIALVIGSNNNGVRSTKYSYAISSSYCPYKSYTNEGFTAITNLKAGDKYANLRYSLKRNILNYYSEYLATANIYNRNVPIKSTFYKNNPNCITTYLGNTVKEEDEFSPTNQILTPMIYDNMIFSNIEFDDFITIQNKVRTERGFISTLDNKGNIIKIFPTELSYNDLEKELTISGEEKFQQAYMTIEQNSGIIIINNETYVLSINYTITENYYINIFSDTNRRLYNAVFWDKVSINGATASNIMELKGWLDLIL